MLYSLLDLCPISLEEIVRKSGLDIQSTIEILLELQLNGYIKEVGHNRYIKKQFVNLVEGKTKMAKYLVIVESPAKVKTIKNFLELIMK